MVEKSLIKHFSKEKLELVKIYIVLLSYEALKANEFLTEHFRSDEIEFIEDEIILSNNYKELFDKINRIIIQKNKRKVKAINKIIPIEEFGPFPKEVEKVLRDNVIDNIYDLLTTKLDYGKATTDTKNYIDFMKKFYDFSKLEKETKKLTKKKKNSKI